MVQDLAVLFLLVYGASVALYLATGVLLTWLNRRHPERRIQSGRDGTRRLRADVAASLKALAVSAALLATGWWAQRQGWTPAPVAAGWWSVPAFFALLFLLFDAWFYWGHRLLHHPAFYRFHALHHRAVAPTPWSNDASTAVDTLIEHGFYLVVWFVLPVPAASVIALRIFDQVTGMIGHSGFEHFAGRASRAPSPLIATTFHDLHHARFTVNYGNFTSLWDRMMGTVDPRYDAMIARIEAGEAPADAVRRGHRGD
ncbi:MAG: desaturase [Paracoccaceae bacterium]|nr:MAG: desaturase [Paracoccaceae bacterium]